MLPKTQMPAVRSSPIPIPPPRRQGRRLLLAIVTLVLAVLAIVGIQTIANRVTAPPTPAVAVEALGTGTAVAAEQHGIGPAAILVLLIVLMAGVKLVSRTRAAGARHTYWDDMPF